MRGCARICAAQIRELQQRLAITTVFVTHDQEEALTISDRIVVMNHGQIRAGGTPRGDLSVTADDDS